jgi:hypothetical protein
MEMIASQYQATQEIIASQPQAAILSNCGNFDW